MSKGLISTRIGLWLPAKGVHYVNSIVGGHLRGPKTSWRYSSKRIMKYKRGDEIGPRYIGRREPPNEESFNRVCSKIVTYLQLSKWRASFGIIGAQLRAGPHPLPPAPNLKHCLIEFDKGVPSIGGPIGHLSRTDKVSFSSVKLQIPIQTGMYSVGFDMIV